MENGNALVVPVRGGVLAPVADTAELIEVRKRVGALISANLVKGRDYDVIPGTIKKTLLQPGAEQVNSWFGVRPVFEIVESDVDHNRATTWEKTRSVKKPKPSEEEIQEKMASGVGYFKRGPKGSEWYEREKTTGDAVGFYRYVVRCKLIRRDTGEEIGQAMASCSSHEGKYCDRPRECENTVLQMAEKRAFVRATRNAYGLSDRFTQDIEQTGHDPDGEVDANRPPVPMPTERVASPAPPPAAAPAPAGDAAQPPAGDAPPPPAADPAGDQHSTGQNVDGLVASTASKPTKKEGVFRYGIKVGDAWYNTFDDAVSGAAERARHEGLRVRIGFAVSKFGNDITTFAVEEKDGKLTYAGGRKEG